MKQRQDTNKNNSPKSDMVNPANSKASETEQQRLEKLRSIKMKAYLDSVSQHKIDETQSEQNASFISQRKESVMGQRKTTNGLDDVNEAEDESKASTVFGSNELASLYKK